MSLHPYSALASSSPGEWADERFTLPGGERLGLSCLRAGHPHAILVVPGLFMTRDCAEHRAFARSLSRVADVYTLDVRGHGDSEGRFSFGAHEPHDVLLLAEWLRRQYSGLGAVGFSLGSHHLATAAANRAPVSALVTVGAPARLFRLDRRLLTRHLGRALRVAAARHGACARLRLPPISRRPSFLDAIASLGDIPLLVAHGTDDWIVPAADAYRIRAKATGTGEVLLVPGAGHAESLVNDATGSFLQSVTRFFERHLPRPTAA